MTSGRDLDPGSWPRAKMTGHQNQQPLGGKAMKRVPQRVLEGS